MPTTNPTPATPTTSNPASTPSTPTVTSSTKDITTYSIPSLGLTGIINGTEIYMITETYSAFVPEIATFTTTGKTVMIGSIEQISGTTQNNYSNSLTYIVTAEDGTTKNYFVRLYAPRTVSSNLKAWFKANSLALTNGANVTSWTDSSGTGNTVTVGSNFPTFITPSINGQPAVNFNGTNNFLEKTSGIGLTTTPHSIITVFKPIVGNNIVVISFGTNACGTDKVFQILPSGALNTGICNVHSLEDLTTIMVSNTNYIASNSYINGATSNLFLNGTLLKSESPSVGNYTNNTNMAIGKRSTSNVAFFNGQIAEILYYDTNLSTPNIQILHCYLSKKYNLTISHTCN